MNTEKIDPHLTAMIVRSYVQHHRVGTDQISDLITSVHQAFGQLGQPVVAEEVLVPAVSVRRSVHQDYVVCLDCGKEFQYDWNEMRVGEPVHARPYRAAAESYSNG